MLKVAIFSRYPEDASCPHGGVESVTVVLVRALARLPELDVHVVTLEHGRGEPVVETRDGATIHRLPGSRWPQLLDIHHGPGRNRLLRYLRELRPDIVHSHETHGLALWNLGMPHVFTVHGFDHANLPAQRAKHAAFRAWLWCRAERRDLARHRHLISITPYVRQMIEPLTSAVIHDIENPVDERFFNVAPRPEPGRALTVGWINERKNTLGAVEVVAEVVRRGIPARLVIAGTETEPGYRRQVEEAIERHGLEDSVEFLGQVAHSQLPGELAKASVMLLPSRQENSPMAIAEAMAAGVPVIASDRCGMPYMVEEGQTGHLVDPEDTTGMADRMAGLLHDPETRARMGRIAGEAARERFHPASVARKTLAVYREVISAYAQRVSA